MVSKKSLLGDWIRRKTMRRWTEKHGSSSRSDDETVRALMSLTAKEARAEYRMAFVTSSQWSIVMDSCGMPLDDAMVADTKYNTDMLFKKVMEWRRNRGDFAKGSFGEDDVDDDGHAGSGVESDEEVPRLSDDMEGVDEPTLQLCFLKTDLQVECLLRGIAYEGSDSKAILISKLLHHKEASCLKSNSFDILAKDST